MKESLTSSGLSHKMKSKYKIKPSLPLNLVLLTISINLNSYLQFFSQAAMEGK